MKLKNIKEVEEFRKVMLSEQGDNLELFADKREDEAKLISFLAELDKENGEA